MDLREFLNMGGYAFFVWTSFGSTALVMGLTWYFAKRRKNQALQRAQRRLLRSNA